MESTSNRQPITANQPTAPVLYSAVAWIAGTYTPGRNKRVAGVLVTPDGEAITAKLHWHSRSQLKKLQRDANEENSKLQEYRFKVYPKTTNPLSVDVIEVKPIQDLSKRSKHKQPPRLDEFRVVGEIMKNSENRVTVCVRRNEQPPVGKENHPCYQPMYLKLEGSLALAAVGEIWELKVRRIGTKLRVKKGHLYQPSKYDLAYLQTLAHLKKESDCLELSVNSASSCASIELELSSDASQTKSTEIVASKKTKQNQQQSKQNVIPTALTTTQKDCSVAREASTAKYLKSTSVLPTKAASTSASKAKKQRQERQKQRTNTSKPQAEQEQKKLAFQVKVNDRLFRGYESVTLNRRMVCIDGKPVAQAKMIVVLGHPAIMQADGGVTSGRHQAVLTSR